ncbi:MAG TPA: phage tail assembly chaperone [Pseudorhodoferax sp.]|nr:phage tail assembly chaperone [Pseudorhodoferax sp.]
MSKTQKSVPVASIKSLGGIAPEFDMPVTVPRLDGTSVELKMRAKGMRKSEWLALRDKHIENVRGNDKPLADAEFSFTRMIGDSMENAVDLLLQGVVGWHLDDEFTKANLLSLEDVLPGSVQAILGSYDAALFHGRLGN